MPSTISDCSRMGLLPTAALVFDATRISKEHPADSRNDTASNAMVTGAVSSCTSPPASEGPTIPATETFNNQALFARTRFSRPASKGTKVVAVLSKSSVMTPARNATA